MRKSVCILLVLALIFGTGVFPDTNKVQATSVKTTKKLALKAYKKLLQKSSFKVNGEKWNSSAVQFAIKDMNHDGIPELLLVNYSRVHLALMTYYAGKVREVDGQHSGHGGFGYYAKGSVYSSGSMIQGYESCTINKIVKGKSKTVAYYTDDSASLSDNLKGREYYIRNKKTTKKKYNSYVKKLTKNSKSKTWDYYEVNAANIKKYIK